MDQLSCVYAGRVVTPAPRPVYLAEKFKYIWTCNHNGNQLAYTSGCNIIILNTSHSDAEETCGKTNEHTQPVSLNRHMFPVSFLTFASDDLQLASADISGAVVVWDIALKPPSVRKECNAFEAQICHMTWSKDGATIKVLGYIPSERIAYLSTTVTISETKHIHADGKDSTDSARIETVSGIKVSPCGTQKARLTVDNKGLSVSAAFIPWASSSRHMPHTISLKSPDHGVRSTIIGFDWSPDSSLIAALYGHKKEILVWNVRKQRALQAISCAAPHHAVTNNFTKVTQDNVQAVDILWNRKGSILVMLSNGEILEWQCILGGNVTDLHVTIAPSRRKQVVSPTLPQKDTYQPDYTWPSLMGSCEAICEVPSKGEIYVGTSEGALAILGNEYGSLQLKLDKTMSPIIGISYCLSSQFLFCLLSNSTMKIIVPPSNIKTSRKLVCLAESYLRHPPLALIPLAVDSSKVGVICRNGSILAFNAIDGGEKDGLRLPLWSKFYPTATRITATSGVVWIEKKTNCLSKLPVEASASVANALDAIRVRAAALVTKSTQAIQSPSLDNSCGSWGSGLSSGIYGVFAIAHSFGKRRHHPYIPGTTFSCQITIEIFEISCDRNYNTDSIHHVRFLTEHQAEVEVIGISKTGDFLASWDSPNQAIWVWSTERGEVVCRYRLNGFRATQIDWTTDGRRLGVGTATGNIIVIDILQAPETPWHVFSLSQSLHSTQLLRFLSDDTLCVAFSDGFFKLVAVGTSPLVTSESPCDRTEPERKKTQLVAKQVEEIECPTRIQSRLESIVSGVSPHSNSITENRETIITTNSYKGGITVVQRLIPPRLHSCTPPVCSEIPFETKFIKRPGKSCFKRNVASTISKVACTKQQTEGSHDVSSVAYMGA